AGRAVVVGAEREARALNHGFIGTEHLMLALVEPETVGRAADLLASYGLDHDELKDAVCEIVGPGEDDVPASTIPFTPRSKKVLELSLREALAARSRTIEPEHILFGILREGDGVGAKLLRDRGITSDLVRSHLGGVRQAPVRRLSRFRMPMMPGMTAGALRAMAEARKATVGRTSEVGRQHPLLGLLADRG